MRYGFVDLFMFVFSERLRYELALRLLTEIRRFSFGAAQYEKGVDIVLHSYSTSIFGLALEIADSLHLELNFRSVVLNGCILPSTYRWDRFLPENGTSGPPNVKFKRLLNVCGDRDVWPVVAKSISSRFGDSGTHFFQIDSSSLKNVRLANCDHSGMLSLSAARGLIDSFVLEGRFRGLSSGEVSGFVEKWDFILRNILFLLPVIVLLVFYAESIGGWILGLPYVNTMAVSLGKWCSLKVLSYF